MGYNNTTTSRDLALADAGVPQALKDLLSRIIPEKRFDEFKSLVASGAITPDMTHPAHLLLSPVSQVMSMADKGDQMNWLKALFAEDPAALATAQIYAAGIQWSTPVIAIDNYSNRYRDYPVEAVPLLRYIAGRNDILVDDIAQLDPALLSVKVKNRDEAQPDQALLHHIFETREMKVPALDRVEAFTGNADFLAIKNPRGETLFFRIATDSANGENADKLDIASWMLQRRPQSANEADRFGWTPLDRLVSRARGAVDTSMGRLLLAHGAKLDKQISPGFNLKAQLQENEGLGLDKFPSRKLSPPAAPSV